MNQRSRSASIPSFSTQSATSGHSICDLAFWLRQRAIGAGFSTYPVPSWSDKDSSVARALRRSAASKPSLNRL